MTDDLDREYYLSKLNEYRALRAKLEALVNEWRAGAAADETWPDQGSQGEGSGKRRCADDLERLLAEKEGE